ncbi:MAG: hypothetical protein AB7V00_00760 [Bacilli bacterium]
MRLKVKVPATFGRLGWEVEGLGIAVTLYNELFFEKAKQWEFVGLPKPNDLYENLIKRSIEKTFWYAKTSVIPFKVSFIQCIPISRGLGFNPSLIASSVVAANYFLDKRFSQTNLLNIASTIHGSYESMGPALFGNLCSTYQFDGEVKNIQYEAHADLVITHLIPKNIINDQQEMVKTNIQDFSYRLAKAINLPKAFEKGDLGLIRELLANQANETIFFNSIKNNSQLMSFCKEKQYPYFINDRTKTITFISKQPLGPTLRDAGLHNDWEIITLSIDKKGTVYEAIL